MTKKLERKENYNCPACGKHGEFDEEDSSWHCVNDPCRVVRFVLT